jgi:hypothetical protein
MMDSNPQRSILGDLYDRKFRSLHGLLAGGPQRLKPPAARLKVSVPVS